MTSPHTVLYADYFHISPGEQAQGSFLQFGAPQVEVQVSYDSAFTKTLMQRCGERHIPAGTFGERSSALDHATMIPLRYLQEFTSSFRVVRIGLSGLSPLVHYRLGQCIADTAEKLGRRTVVIASGDLSHKLTQDGPYGYAPEGPQFDKETTVMLQKGDFLSLLSMDPDLCEAAAECGLRSFWIMAGALDRKALRSELLSYEGPFGVGYGVASFLVTSKDNTRNFGEQYATAEKRRAAVRQQAEDPWVRLARLSLETYVRTGQYAALPKNLPPELAGTRAGAFVSLKKDGRLRGCIGTVQPTQKSVAEEILNNAVSAAVHDPRFGPVTPEELPQLVYSVDVLQMPEAVASSKELDAKRYGVIVQNGNRSGLLLPNLAGVDTAEEQIAIARQKAGISPYEPVKLWRFRVVRHT